MTAQARYMGERKNEIENMVEPMKTVLSSSKRKDLLVILEQLELQ